MTGGPVNAVLSAWAFSTPGIGCRGSNHADRLRTNNAFGRKLENTALDTGLRDVHVKPVYQQTLTRPHLWTQLRMSKPVCVQTLTAAHVRYAHFTRFLLLTCTAFSSNARLGSRWHLGG